MRAALVACLLLGACGPGPVRVTASGPSPGRFRDYPDPAPTTTTTSSTTSTTVPEPTTVAPHPAPVAASRSRGAPNCGGWYDLVATYDWPTDTACRILMCESGGDPDAVNASSGATGLFQILRGPTDPAENVALAHDMWTHRGWQPWVCR